MVLIRWFPPSWIQLKAENRVLYIDPAYLKTYYAEHLTKIEFSSWPDPIDGLPEKLQKADVVLVTHHHKDHMKRVTVERLRRSGTVVFAPKRCRRELGEDMKPVKEGDEFARRGFSIRVVPAYNTESGSSARKMHHRGECVGYVVSVGGATSYHAGDTDFVPEMHEIGPVDVALLPIGGTCTMDIADAVRAALAISPRCVIPMHHLRADPSEFGRALARESDIEAVLLSIGEGYSVG